MKRSKKTSIKLLISELYLSSACDITKLRAKDEKHDKLASHQISFELTWTEEVASRLCISSNIP